MLPIGVMVGLTVVLLVTTGIAETKAKSAPLNLINIFGNADSYLALVYASLSGLL
ncbi:MAG: hypothetical protein GTO41_20545, partial [Burkholderiales bacterium]|nr:hypothetical protein [Burkholderiales bacterium]